MDLTALVIRFMADWLIVIMILISVVALLRTEPARRKKRFIEAFIVIAIGFLFTRVLLTIFSQGYRPYVELGVNPGAWASSNSGFPSEHAMVAMSLVLIVWVSTRNKALSVLLLGFAFAVCLGRIAALVHAPIDVIVGSLCAGLASAIVYRDRLFKTH